MVNIDRHNKEKINIVIENDIYIRCVKPEDVNEAYVNGLNDHNLVRFLNFPSGAFYTRESVKQYVEKNYRSYHDILFGIFKSNALFGTSRLHIKSANDAEVGIFIFDKAMHGKGYASKMLNVVSDYAGQNFGVKKITAGIDNSNTSSRRCFHAAGFEIEKIDKKYTACLREIWVKNIHVSA